jgi:hypothetical protein
MFQSCPATGRLFHQFNKETHRCACGRWQAGFAPKKVSKNPRAECQVCERVQALTKDGVLVHHGYERPGHGWIVGDCFGVGHKPYTATDALEEWHGWIEQEIARTVERGKDLLVATEVPCIIHQSGRNQPDITITLRVGDRADYTPGRAHSSFEDHRNWLVKLNAQRLEQAEVELVRIARRIINATQKQVA